MKSLVLDFIYNLKIFLKYIVKVGFKELATNVLILICMAIIAAFAYVPVGMIEDLLRDLLSVFISFGDVFGELYIWVFGVIEALASLLLFMYLFNMRYDFKNGKVVPLKGSYTLKRDDEIENKEENKEKKEVKQKEYDLPKEKEEK